MRRPAHHDLFISPKILCLAALLAGVAGCRDAAPEVGAEAPAAATPPSDSAGVQLVRNGGQGAWSGSALEAQPDLRIGSASGPEALQFHRIGAITVTPAGSILVSDGGSGGVREFDVSGRHVRTLGRKGDGPGEFQRPGRTFLFADTLVVFDGTADRLTFYGPGRRVLRTEPTRAGRWRLYPLARTAAGWLAEVHEFGEWRYREWQPRQDTVRVYLIRDLVAWAGQGGVAAADSTGAAREVLRFARGRMYGIPTPLSMTANAPLWEPEPWLAADARGRLYFSPGLPYRIDVHEEGRLVRRITRTHEPVRITDALYDRYFRASGRYLDTTRMQHAEWPIEEGALRGRARLPRNDALPALRRLLVSPEGAIWAERPDLVEDPLTLEWTEGTAPQATHWDVFDVDGRLLGTVRLPARFTPRFVTPTAAWGVQRDGADVETVVRYSLKGQ